MRAPAKLARWELYGSLVEFKSAHKKRPSKIHASTKFLSRMCAEWNQLAKRVNGSKLGWTPMHPTDVSKIFGIPVVIDDTIRTFRFEEST